MDVAMTTFETKTKSITLMDAPGHRDFIPNMIQGTAQVIATFAISQSASSNFFTSIGRCVDEEDNRPLFHR